MSVPDKVKIGGLDYYVEMIENLEYSQGLGGQILYQKALIHIEESMAEDRREQIFVHEVLHGIFNEAGYDEQDEDMINRVGKVLYQVLKDNKFKFGE